MKTYVIAAFVAVLTTVLTVIATNPLNTFLDRAKPSIVITSIGLQSPATAPPIPLSNDLVNLSRETNWTDPLFPFEDFAHLAEVEKQAGENGERLRRAIGLVEEWMRRVPSGKPLVASKAQFLRSSEVSQLPMTTEPMVLMAIVATVRRGDLRRPPPQALRAVHASKLLFPTFDDKVKGVAYVTVSNPPPIPFAYHGLPAGLSNQIHLLAESFARGARPNLAFYSDLFLSISRGELPKLQALRQRLRDLLLFNSSLSANITIANRGKTAIIFQPDFTMDILQPADLGLSKLLMTSKALRDTVTTAPPSQPPLLTVGRRVFERPFLPEAGARSYINIPPGELKEVALVGTRCLGNVGGRVRSAALKCQVKGVTTDNSTVASVPVDFRESN